MGVTVVNNALAASTAVTRARASVVIVAPIAETSAALLAAATSISIADAVVTAVVPVVNLSYIFMATGAYLDTSGQFQYFPDQVFVADASFRVVGKTLTDNFAQVDSTVKFVNLPKADTVSISESVLRTLEYIRSFFDTTTTAEATNYTFAKSLATAFTATELKTFTLSKFSSSFFSSTDFATTHLTKNNFESVPLADSAFTNVTKGLADNFTQTEAISRNTDKALVNTFTATDATSYAFARPVASSFGSTDFTTTHLTKFSSDSFSFTHSLAKVVNNQLTDTFSHVDSTAVSADKVLAHFVITTDAHSKVIGRVIADGFAMNDSADLADGITYQTVKFVNNLAFVSDAKVLSSSLAIADTVNLSSSGFLTSQNYCDVSYFAEDYVGDSRTFS